MIITFGKNKGQDTEILAKTSNGRNYLAWGSENLESPKWRNAFSTALENGEINLVAEANEIASEDGLAWDEAYQHALDEQEDVKQHQAMMLAFGKTKANLRKNLSNIGIAKRHISKLVYIITIGDVDESIAHKVIRFSTKEKEQNFLSVVAQYDIDFEEIGI